LMIHFGLTSLSLSAVLVAGEARVARGLRAE
jgi:hypothetical protein